MDNQDLLEDTLDSLERLAQDVRVTVRRGGEANGEDLGGVNPQAGNLLTPHEVFHTQAEQLCAV